MDLVSALLTCLSKKRAEPVSPSILGSRTPKVEMRGRSQEIGLVCAVLGGNSIQTWS